MSLFTYQIDYGAGWVAASPKGEWSITNERNEGQIFFRRTFTGDLVFVGDDYTTIIAQTECEILEFRILCDGAEYWVGQFKFPYDFDIDEDSCFLKGTPEVVDEYSCIMNNYETEFVVDPLVGVINPEIRTCPPGNVLLIAMSNCFRLGTPGAGALNGYLNALINTNMGCALTLRSAFMWRDDFANGDNYAASYGATNYITGATNRLEFVYVTKNTLLRTKLGWGGTACEGADFTTFKEWESLLRNAFNAYWFIDQNGDFRIEHIHYFDVAFPESDFINSPDLQTIISNNGKSFAYRKNKYSYEIGRLYDQEFWSWQHYTGTEGTIAHGADFAGVPVFYGAAVGQKSSCVPGEFKEKEIASPKFWTDIFWAYSLIAAGTTDTMSCPGWCLVDVDTGPFYIRCETSMLGVGNIINMHLSNAALQDNYHTWDRIFLAGNMNSGGVVAFDSAIPSQLQESIEFPVCCDDVPDPLNRIVTELGNGKVKAMTIKQNSVEVELLY